MFYYLLIGVHRSPWYSADDCDSFFPFLHNVQSELALTINELETAFELKVKNHWELLFDEALDDLSLEELQNCDPNNGYLNLDYFYCSFPKIFLFHFESSPLHQNTIDMFL